MTDARNFLLDTDYPTDILSYIDTKHFIIGGGDTFAHNLPFTPLTKVVWSISPTFDVLYGVGNGPLANDVSTPFIPQLINAYSNSSDIGLIFGTPGGISDVYIRLYGYAPPDYTGTASNTNDITDNFLINTDNNYTKLFMYDKTAVVTAPLTTVSVFHNLGYIPQMDWWYSMPNGNIFCGSSTNLLDGNIIDVCASPYDDRIEFTSSVTGNNSFYYRIYMDEQL